MILQAIPKNKLSINLEIDLPSSKSQSNRALMIQALSESHIEIHNLSDAEDTLVLRNALLSKNSTIDIHYSGTAFRFLCAYLSIQKSEFILSGSERIQERPISNLVNALRSLGAKIEYINKQNYAPLRISGNSELAGGVVELDASISSQFVSALMMIAPVIRNGLSIILQNAIVSNSFIELTAEMMRKQGIVINNDSKLIQIKQQKYNSDSIYIEADFASASYWYAIFLASDQLHTLSFNNLCKKSKQPDKKLIEIFNEFGIESIFKDKILTIHKKADFIQKKNLEFDLLDSPDLAQTIMCICAILNIQLVLTGLKTLPSKETDRLQAMKSELKKFEVEVTILKDFSIEQKGNFIANPNAKIETYSDHRMAMSFACTVFKNKKINIQDPDVVRKSYPNFWNEFMKVADIKFLS